MADRSKRTPLISEDSESTPLISQCSSNETSEQRDLDVQQHESSTTESDKGNFGSVAVTDAGDVNIDRAGSSGDGDNRKELIGESEVNEAEIALGEVPQECCQQPIIRFKPRQDVRSLAIAAANESREAASYCRSVMYAIYESITEAQDRVRKARREAEGATECESSHYLALASRYDDAAQLANRRARRAEAAIKSAENAATAAETAARQVVEEPNEDFNVADRLSAADNAATVAKRAAITAYKTEYLAVKAMKRCWEDLDHRNVESTRLLTRHPEETRCGGSTKGKITAWILGTVLFILGFSLLAGVVPYTKNPEHRNALIAVGSILVAITVCTLIREIVVYIKNKKTCEQKENDLVMECIDYLLGELDSHIKTITSTPVHSDDEQ